MSDFYEILGVAKDCSQDDIKKAYRKLAMQYHPDRTQGDAEATEKFKEVGEAYEVLSNPTSRRNYDLGSHGTNGSGFHHHETGFDPRDHFRDFDDIFNAHFAGFHRGSRPNKMRQRNIVANLDASIDLIVEGSDQKIHYNRRNICAGCQGKKTKEENGIQKCVKCQGSGRFQAINQNVHLQITCPDCQGKGQTNTAPCPDCQGKGFIINRESVSFNIPKGCPEGHAIQIEGMGHEYAPGQFGDLMIAVRCAPHPLFQRINHSDLIMEFPIPVHCAIAGLEIEIPTVHGMKTIEVPQKLQNGQRFACSGLGLPKFENPDKNGTLYIVGRLEVPSSIDEHVKEAMKSIPIDQATYPHYQNLMDNIKEAQAARNA